MCLRLLAFVNFILFLSVFVHVWSHGIVPNVYKKVTLTVTSVIVYLQRCQLDLDSDTSAQLGSPLNCRSSWQKPSALCQRPGLDSGSGNSNQKKKKNHFPLISV